MIEQLQQLYHDWAPYLLIVVILIVGQYNSIAIGRNERRIDKLERN